ncbi:MAG: SDR family oxidoreductase [Candidatus Zixiibacteriota bacterium]
MDTILVTGGAGFIGSNLVGLLSSNGSNVRVLDNFSTGKRENLAGSPENVEIIEGDIRDPEAVESAARDATQVYHLAAISSVLLSVDEPANTWETNVSGTWNVLEAARRNGAKRMVFASSASVYGDCSVVPFRESLPLSGSSPYATSKLIGEQLCELYYRLYGLETVCLRFFSVYGPRQNPNSQYSAVIPNFATRLLKGETPTIYGDGEQTRDFIFVDDVVRAVSLAGNGTNAVGEVVNIGTGKQLSVNDLLKAVQGALKTYIEPEFAPLKPGDDPRTCADTSKAQSMLAFSPRMSVETGLARTVKWFAGQYRAKVK